MLDTTASLSPTLALPGAASAAQPAVARAEGAAAVDFSAVLAGATLGIDIGEAPETTPPPPSELAVAQAANAGRPGIVGNRPGKILPPGKPVAEPELAAEENEPEDTIETEPSSAEDRRSVADDGAAPAHQNKPVPQEPAASLPPMPVPASDTAASPPAGHAAASPLPQAETALVPTAAVNPRPIEPVVLAPAARTNATPPPAPLANAPEASLRPTRQNGAPASRPLPIATATLLQPAPTKPVTTAAVTTPSIEVTPQAEQAPAIQPKLPAARDHAAGLVPAQALPEAVSAALSPAPAARAPKASPVGAASAQLVPATPLGGSIVETLVAPQATFTAPPIVSASQDASPLVHIDASLSQPTDSSVDAAPASISVEADTFVHEKAETLHASMSVRATASVDAPQPMVQAAPLLVTTPALDDIGLAASTQADAGQDIATLVDRIVEARAAAAPDTVRAALVHEEFGSISLRLRADDSHIHVTLGSADPTFAPAVHAAAASLSGSAASAQDERREQPAPQPQHTAGQDAGAPNAQTSQQHQSARNSASTTERVSPRDDSRSRDSSEQTRPDQSAPDRRGGIYA